MDTTVQPWFTDFLYNWAGFPEDSLPITSPFILTAQRWGQGIVPWEFKMVCPAPDIYQLAVNYAGASFLLNFCPDVPTASNPTFFSDRRQAYGIETSQIGALTSVSDQGTSVGYALPDWFKGANMQELMWMKDPHGRQLLAILQQYGSLWGLS